MKYFKYTFTFTIIVIISLISAGLSEETDKNCQLFFENGEELDILNWAGVTLPAIDDTTKPNTEILKYKAKNIDDIRSVTSPAKYYFNVYLDYNGDYFYIKVNNDFVEYEERETLTRFDIKVEFDCKNEDTRDIVFKLNIKDTNNHAPEFLKAPYTFNLPMPIPKDYDFEQLGKIVARDIDLTNEYITFAFKKDDENSKGLSIVSNGRDKKNFPAKLMALDTLDLENDVTFMIYATDSGEPSLITNTTVTIVVDKGNSVPRFSQALYTADLTKLSYNKDKEVAVTFSQGAITLERGYEGVRSFEISGVSEENKKHLKLTHTGILRKNIKLQLKLVDLTEKFLSQRVLSLIITAVKDKVKTDTALQILLPAVKSNIQSNSTTEKPKGEAKTGEDDSTDGYMIATIILSLTTVGLLGGVIYLFINRN